MTRMVQREAIDIPIMQTARLLLHRPNTYDIPSIIAAVDDWEIARRMGRIPHPYGEADARFFLDTIVPNEWVWAIIWQESGELIGCIGLTPKPELETAELGYWIARKHWGRGITTEAGKAVVAFGLETLGLPRLISGHFADNPASGRVLAKLGFVEVEHATRPCLATNSVVPSVEVCLRREAAAA